MLSFGRKPCLGVILYLAVLYFRKHQAAPVISSQVNGLDVRFSLQQSPLAGAATSIVAAAG
jgi:hypothetical protein